MGKLADIAAQQFHSSVEPIRDQIADLQFQMRRESPEDQERTRHVIGALTRESEAKTAEIRETFLQASCTTYFYEAIPSKIIDKACRYAFEAHNHEGLGHVEDKIMELAECINAAFDAGQRSD